MKHILWFFAVTLSLAAFSNAQFLAWEDIRNLGNIPVTSVASDAYGQHVVGVSNGAVKHYLYRNDGVLIYNTLSVSGAESPSVTSYNRKVRVTMKLGYDVKVYQSTDGGASWPTIFSGIVPFLVDFL